MSQTPPTTPLDETDDDDDDTVQGVSRRAERLRAEAQRIQDEQNAAAGMTTPEPAPPAETPTTPPATGRKPSGA